MTKLVETVRLTKADLTKRLNLAGQIRKLASDLPGLKGSIPINSTNTIPNHNDVAFLILHYLSVFETDLVMAEFPKCSEALELFLYFKFIFMNGFKIS